MQLFAHVEGSDQEQEMVIAMQQASTYNALEFIFEANGHLHSSSIQAKLGAQLFGDTPGVAALTIKLVDERDARYTVALHLAVYCDALRKQNGIHNEIRPHARTHSARTAHARARAGHQINKNKTMFS